MFDLTVFLRDFDVFKAMDKVLFDQRDNFVGAFVSTLFCYRVDPKD